MIFLVPGFFGFTSIGALNYFHRVADVLQQALRTQGIEATVLECATQPTGSIRRRAELLLDKVENEAHDAEALHFVGHSTGGLDIRLLLTPGVRLRSDDIEERIGERTRSVITVATPHFGTPIANFFTTLLGRQLLQILTVLATTSSGRMTLLAASRALATVSRLDDLIGRRQTFLDSLVERLLGRLSGDEADPFWQFLRQVASDQGAIIQLTPESMHLFNAAVTDRVTVRYSSLVTAAPPPPKNFRVTDLLSLARAAMAGSFAVLHGIAGREHQHYPYPHEGHQALDRWRTALPFSLDQSTNDGVVPTLSQVYGRILDCVVADHLDIVGQFPNASAAPHSDWLPSGSRFTQLKFEECWSAVAQEIAKAQSNGNFRQLATNRP